MTYTEAWEGLAGVGSELGSLLSPTACLHSFQPPRGCPLPRPPPEAVALPGREGFGGES